MSTQNSNTATTASSSVAPAYNAGTGDGTEEVPKKRRLNKRFLVVLGLLVVVGGSFGAYSYFHGQYHEETDDAQIDANISPVIPRIAGYVESVRVNDNQSVRKGDTLVVLDTRDLVIKVEQAEAALSAAQGSLNVTEGTTNAAQAAVASSQANIGTVNAQIEVARVALQRATQDYNRYATLIKDHSITQQQYEQGLAAKQTADAQLRVLQEQRAAAVSQTATAASQSSATGRNIGVANATIRQREAEVNNARLSLSYAYIIAPTAGYVSKVNVQPGQAVQQGQSLFAIVPGDYWVVANFKETQLAKMKVGQEAEVRVDALGKTFTGKLASFSPATGSRFSLLPPDNASGNFVRVVQRVPVRIEFSDKNNAGLQQLRAGMNCDVDVHL